LLFYRKKRWSRASDGPVIAQNIRSLVKVALDTLLTRANSLALMKIEESRHLNLKIGWTLSRPTGAPKTCVSHVGRSTANNTSVQPLPLSILLKNCLKCCKYIQMTHIQSTVQTTVMMKT
jgi:hypothetical protein